MIATFPSFSSLSINHKKAFESIVNRYEPYSDFNFVSLFSWDVDDTTQIATLGNNLVITFPHYITGEPLYSIIGSTRIDHTLQRLLNTTPRLELVPEIIVDNIQNKSGFSITEDRDNFDYIYDVSSLSALAGNDFKKKRNKVNRIKTAFGAGLTVKTYKRPASTADLRDGFQEWAKNARKSNEDIQAEYQAFERLLDNIPRLNVLITKVHLFNQLVGFSVNEVVHEGYAICHFEKAISAHEDMASYLVYAVAGELLRYGCKTVNWEQDLGISGLRQAKLAYRPSYFLKKYTITKAIQ